MTSFEKRLADHFDPADIQAARDLTPTRLSCPRVGQVRAIFKSTSGDTQEVFLELAAGRRGGMTLESHSTSQAGRAGRPCSLLAATLMEIDRRSLLSTIHDHTPVILDVIPSDDLDEQDDPVSDSRASNDVNKSDASQSSATRTVSTHPRRGSGRQPSWATELEERRRLVEPAVRTMGLALADARRVTGALVFVLDITASVDAHGVVVIPSRMQVDVTGQTTGRPKPIVLGPGNVELNQLDELEYSLVAQLVGTVSINDASEAKSLEQRTITRIMISPDTAASHLSRLCETGRLVVQPEPRRQPELVEPLAWDGGSAWEFAIVLDPEDDDSLGAALKEDTLPSNKTPKKLPPKATLRGMLVRGSERKNLNEPRAILKSGLIVFSDRLARLSLRKSAAGQTSPTAWMDQFERRGPIELTGSQVDGLIEQLASLANVPKIILPGWTGWRVESGAPRPKLVLGDIPSVAEEEVDTGRPKRGRKRNASRIQLAGNVWFDYSGMMIAADDPAGGAADAARRLLVRRDYASERHALSTLPNHGATAVRQSERDVKPLHHVEIPRGRLDAAVPQLAAAGWAVEVAGRQYRPAGSVAWNVTSGIDWFELAGTVDFGGISADMPELLSALARGERSVQLSDGSVGILPDDFASQFEPMAVLAQKNNGALRYSRMQVALLDALLAGQPTAHIDEAFDRIREELADGERPDAADEPDGFEGTLRHYQREGLGWLAFLERMGLGGCLADDMGLGKTIQVLALLVRRQGLLKDSGIAHRPTLVIVPKSLIFNWIEEAKKFAPDLKVLNFTGNARIEFAPKLTTYDLVLTTYGTLRRDIMQHRDKEFDYVILDEAQSIKNASSQAAKACRLLKARHRLAVTGTPVENHIGELWSIFEFLNPGQLGSATRLKKFLAGGRGNGSEIIAKAVHPYLLRRTKTQVLSDLPEKTEQTIFCELGEKQRKVYDELREHYRQELTGRIGRMGIGRSRIAVLEALLRLRQTSCHPGLIDKDRIDEPGAKLETLLEQLGEVLDEGHKVLIFSQFTSFLSILRHHLDKQSTVYEYLDGKTTDRQAHVHRFQEDPDCRLFLISLKAGGQGLNLTAADYIYILDPWWNPAVEAQAVDRAHRIGQTRRVFAYRLIARDTVEEKILALQEKKRELAESIVQADDRMIANLTAEDVELLLS